MRSIRGTFPPGPKWEELPPSIWRLRSLDERWGAWSPRCFRDIPEESWGVLCDWGAGLFWVRCKEKNWIIRRVFHLLSLELLFPKSLTSRFDLVFIDSSSKAIPKFQEHSTYLLRFRLISLFSSVFVKLEKLLRFKRRELRHKRPKIAKGNKRELSSQPNVTNTETNLRNYTISNDISATLQASR